MWRIVRKSVVFLSGREMGEEKNEAQFGEGKDGARIYDEATEIWGCMYGTKHSTQTPPVLFPSFSPVRHCAVTLNICPWNFPLAFAPGSAFLAPSFRASGFSVHSRVQFNTLLLDMYAENEHYKPPVNFL